MRSSHSAKSTAHSAPGRVTMTMGPISESMVSVWSSVIVARVSMVTPASA